MSTSAYLYARVSSKEQREGYSIDAQLEILRDYAKTKSITIVSEFIDVESAKQAGRTKFSRMIQLLKIEHRKKRDQCKIVLVEKTDRLYRNLKDYISMDDLGLEIHFVKENFILSEEVHSSQKFLHGIKVLMAKNYVDNLSEEVKKGMRKKAELGIYPSRAPFGYKNYRTENSSIIIIDDKEAIIVRKIFSLYKTRKYSVLEVTKIINNIQSLPKTIWMSKIHKILTNKFYIGKYNWRGVEYSGTHEKMITEKVYNIVQANLAFNSNRHTFVKRELRQFQGIVKCEYCGAAMAPELKKGKYIYYRCTTRDRNGHCKLERKYVSEKTLKEEVHNCLKNVIYSEHIFQQLSVMIRTICLNADEYNRNKLESLRSELKVFSQRLDSLYTDKVDGSISLNFYTKKKLIWEERLKTIYKQVEEVKSGNLIHFKLLQKLPPLCQSIAREYNTATLEELRNIMLFFSPHFYWNGERLGIRLREVFMSQVFTLNLYKAKSTTKICVSDAFVKVVGLGGVEPPHTESESAVLPLYYSPPYEKL